MKHKPWTYGAAVALSVVAVTGGIGCLVSGMLVEGNLLLVAMIAAITAAVGGFCFQRRLSYVPGIFLVALGLLLWVLGPLNRSAEYLVWHVSSLYDAGYGVGVLRWTQESLRGESGTWVLCYGAGWLSLAVTRSVIKQGKTFLGTMAVLLPLLPCLVLTDTVPKAGFLFATLLCFIILLLTQTVRNQNPAQGARLTALLAVPVAVALGLLLLLCPRETYTGQAGAEKLEALIASWFDVEISDAPIRQRPTKLSVAADVGAEEVALTEAGPQNPGTRVVMRVQGAKTDTVYLRGSAYDGYDGFKWTVSSGDWSRDGEFAPSSGKELTLKVTTTDPHNVRYLAYMPREIEDLQNGRVENADEATEYVVQYAPSAGYQNTWETLKQAVPSDMQMYLTLPDATKTDAREYLRTSVGLPKENMTAGEVYRYATTIGALVRNSANYDLNTPEMPEDAADFALWFLRESDTGYCVHYASATAVLLRAAGIPARYVSGYLVKAQENSTVEVRHKDAHAWVEYYIPGVGWMMLESTASGEDSPVVVTRPTETDPPEEPTETTVPTEPDETETAPAPTEKPREPIPREEPTESRESDGRGSILPVMIAVAAVAILAQWRVRVALRRQDRRRGKTNAQALSRWREAALCAKLLGVKPDARLHALAQKAKFSREIITPQELRQFEDSLKESRKKLKEKPIWNQLVYTLIFALY